MKKIKPKVKDVIIKINCPECGGRAKNHVVVKEHVVNDTDGYMHATSIYQICKCQGCDDIKFRQCFSNSEDYDYDEDGNIEYNEHIDIFPNHTNEKFNVNQSNLDFYPEKVKNVYLETIKALNSDARILAGGGLRAIVEAICNEEKLVGRTLEDKIKKLKEKDFLTQVQCDLLHEERYIGNKALHELEAPSISDLRDGLEIIESLIKTIYILPIKAKQLKTRRTKK